MGRRRVDVEELLEQLGIEAEGKAGGWLWSSCPSPGHRDSDPSWRILDDPSDPDHGRHHCFGCGFGGWPVHLAEAVLFHHVEDEGDRRQLARDWLNGIVEAPVPMEVRVEVAPTRSRRQLSIPRGVKFGPVHSWSGPARQYLLGRGVMPWQVTRWGIGYGAAGRLRGRIVFPVRDSNDKLIGYTSRTFIGSNRKYLEPSKDEGATLGAMLGERYWPPRVRRRVVLVAEGSFDCMALERAAHLPVAGLYGSNLAQRHVQMLSTFPRIVLFTDPDKAGDSVANQVAEALSRYCEVNRASVPEGHDCASLWDEDRSALSDLVRGAIVG